MNGPMMAALLVMGFGDSAPTDARTPAPAVRSPQDLHAQLPAKDFLLINVHIPYEGEIPGTDVHIPYNDVDAIVSFIGTDPDVNVVLYCRTNTMAMSAGNALVERGYRNIRTLMGGMRGWQAVGYPLLDHRDGR